MAPLVYQNTIPATSFALQQTGDACDLDLIDHH
jgi:hypothetical protein